MPHLAREGCGRIQALLSGGTLDRPALKRLLADIEDGRINVVVVYKIDRLSRSLMDFAKLVEVFDRGGVTFVSVTQSFNTTTSMGRLTLNILLSFAQFEREVIGERIRDKIAASKRKGLWVGGKTPLGYESRARKIVVVEAEAERVRFIFRSYLEVGSIHRLMPELARRGIVTKLQRLKSGQTIGGIPFTSGPLSYLLRNRFYIGEVAYKGEVLPGEQQPIIDRALFEAVQAKLAEQQNNHVTTRTQTAALLTGRIFDDHGNRMSPSHARKNGIRYRYYTSLSLLRGEPDRAGSIRRVPAPEIEAAVASALRQELGAAPGSDDRELIQTHVSRVEVQPGRLLVELQPASNDPSEDHPTPRTIRIPWQKPPAKRRRAIIVPPSAAHDELRPIRADSRARLIAAIARGRAWLDELVTGAVTDVAVIAAREGCSRRKVHMTMSLAFLAPDLVKAALEGRLPRGIGIARLCDPPAEWSRQYLTLGLPQP